MVAKLFLIIEFEKSDWRWGVDVEWNPSWKNVSIPKRKVFHFCWKLMRFLNTPLRDEQGKEVDLSKIIYLKSNANYTSFYAVCLVDVYKNYETVTDLNGNGPYLDEIMILPRESDRYHATGLKETIDFLTNFLMHRANLAHGYLVGYKGMPYVDRNHIL